jgi:hypothetical protein
MTKLNWRVGLVIMLALAMGCAEVFDRADRRDRWDTLGRAEVDGPRDRDTIVVGRDGGRYRQLRLEVRGDPVEIHEIVVTFGDGSTYKPDFRERLADRGSSRVLDLPDRRGLQKVDFVYSTRRDGRAAVVLYGR